LIFYWHQQSFKLNISRFFVLQNNDDRSNKN